VMKERKDKNKIMEKESIIKAQLLATEQRF
jgi:hypothetical protein